MIIIIKSKYVIVNKQKWGKKKYEMHPDCCTTRFWSV